MRDYLIPEAQFAQHSGAVIFDEHVRDTDESQQDISPRVCLEVQSHATLVAVGKEEENTFTVQVGVSARPTPLPSPSAGRLDLYHVRTEVCERLNPRWPLEEVCKRNDLHALKKHARTSPFRTTWLLVRLPYLGNMPQEAEITRGAACRLDAGMPV